MHLDAPQPLETDHSTLQLQILIYNDMCLLQSVSVTSAKADDAEALISPSLWLKKKKKKSGFAL